MVEQARAENNPFVQLYIHITGIAGALSIVNLADDFHKFSSFVVDVANSWTNLVQPVAHFLFGWFVYRVFVAETLREQLEQFLLLGLIYAFGFVRFFYFYRGSEIRIERNGVSVMASLGCLFAVFAPFVMYLYVTSWPFWVLILTLEIIFLPTRRLHFLFALHAPLIYFVLIVCCDYLFRLANH